MTIEHETGDVGVEHGPHCATCTCGCTCGYGGQHEPANARCDLNQATTPAEPPTEAGDPRTGHYLCVWCGYECEDRDQMQEHLRDHPPS